MIEGNIRSLDILGEDGVVDGSEDAEILVARVLVLIAVGHHLRQDEALLQLFLPFT